MSEVATPLEVRVELLSPAELDARVALAPIAYLPLGSIEFHSSHLPVGLDALNAHGVSVAAARAGGGVVLPTVYQGLGGEHSPYPWTIMMDSDEGVRAHLLTTLARLQDFGVTTAVLFTGHFAGEQFALIDATAAEWNSRAGRTLTVIATGVNKCPTAPIDPDHAGVFETTLLHALHPELVHVDRLPSLEEHPAQDPEGNTWGRQRHDQSNPLWGIFGPDPREFDPGASSALLDSLVFWLVDVARRPASDEA